MLVYPEGVAAVSAAARMIEQTRLRSPLPVHASAHVGAAIAAMVNTTGSSVNLAARLLASPSPTSSSRRAKSSTEPRTHTTGNHSARRRSAASGSQLDVFCLPSPGDASTDQHRCP